MEIWQISWVIFICLVQVIVLIGLYGSVVRKDYAWMAILSGCFVLNILNMMRILGVTGGD